MTLQTTAKSTNLASPPKISVCIPVYNVELYIRECLDSVITQTLKDIEIILVNDCSTDSSGQIIDEYAARDSRICVTHFNKNQGTLIARKQTILSARGEYIVFLDPDDYYSRPDALQDIYQLIKNENVDILMYCCEHLENGKTISPNNQWFIPFNKRLKNNIEILDSSFNKVDFGWTLWNKIFKNTELKKAISKITDSRITWAEDALIFFIFGYHLNSFLGIKTKPVITYRLSSGISTKTTEQNKIQYIKNYRNLITTLNKFLNQHVNQNSEFLSNVINRIIQLHVITILRICFNEKLTQNVFNKIKENFKPSEIINELFFLHEKNLIKLTNYISDIKINTDLKFQDSKNVGIYFYSLKQGGTEKIISLQAALLKKLGYRVVLFIEEFNQNKQPTFNIDAKIVIIPNSYNNDRAILFEKAIIDNKIEMLIHHAALSPNLLFDTLLIKLLGIRLIHQRHALFAHTFQFNLGTDHISSIAKIHSLADKLLVLTRMDELHFRSLGCDNCFYLPNIIQSPVVKSYYDPKEDMILWIGRLAEVKNYQDALNIIKNVVQERPHAKLVILGRESDPDSGQFVWNFIKKNNLENNVFWPGAVTDITPYINKAKICLVTSQSESFSLAIAESKSYGVPLVTYSMPYLELLRDKKGYIEIPQGDIQAATKAIISLLDNPDLCRKLSAEAKETIEPFKTFDHENVWKCILSGTDLSRSDFSPHDQCELYQTQINTIAFATNLSQKISFNKFSLKQKSKSVKFTLSDYLKYKITSKITFGNTRTRHKEKYQKLKRALRNISD